jgi:beta-N-acetylhexosaminidase
MFISLAGACKPATVRVNMPEIELAAVAVPAASDLLTTPRPARREPNPFMVKARGMASALSDRELAGQLIMTGVDGAGRIPGPSRQLLADLLPGAVLLFGYNIPPDPLELGRLWEDLHQLVPSGGLMPFIAIDHEGGSVFRFKSGLTRLPSARAMSAGGLEAARLAGRIAGTELASLGISMNLAPVFEALDGHNDAFLDSRAWSDDPAEAAALAAAFASSCQASGVAAVAKHFPGNAAIDPHHGLPVLDVSFEELEAWYLQSFAVAVSTDISAVMLSHVLIPVVDPELPVTLSPAAIGLLRDRLGFEGIIMSDDLAMAAISGARSPEAGALMALQAGVDLIMVSGTRQAVQVRDAILRALEGGQLEREALIGSAARIMAQKLRFALHRDEPDEREARRAGLKALVQNNRIALESILGK